MFNQYPYLNLNDLNLDYILKAIKEMRYEVTNFVSINAIKYADPIQWNITSQYEKNTIVIDPVTGTAYISVAPVPAGVALTRPEYWTVVFDLGSFVTRAAQNFTSRWESDTTLTATFSTPAGGWLVWGDVLYKALVNITAGDSYVPNGNIEHFTIEDIYNAILQDIANEVQARIDADSALSDRIYDEVQARQDADTALQGAIDNEVQARQDADTALQGAIDNEVQARQNADGNLDDLSTTDKSNLVAAINEVNSTGGGAIGMIGDLSNLDTDDKSNLVNAINEIAGEVNTLNIYNVLDYGAVGDGVTDDTAAIQACIDAAPSGAIVYAPKDKTYKLNGNGVNIYKRGTFLFNGTYIVDSGNGVGFYIDKDVEQNIIDSFIYIDIVKPSDAYSIFGTTPSSRNASGACGVRVRYAIGCHLQFGQVLGFDNVGIWFECDGLTVGSGTQNNEIVLHNYIDIGTVAHCGYGVYLRSESAERNCCEANEFHIVWEFGCYQDLRIDDNNAAYCASTSNLFIIAAIDDSYRTDGGAGVMCCSYYNKFIVAYMGCNFVCNTYSGFNDISVANTFDTDLGYTDVGASNRFTSSMPGHVDGTTKLPTTIYPRNFVPASGATVQNDSGVPADVYTTCYNTDGANIGTIDVYIGYKSDSLTHIMKMQVEPSHNSEGLAESLHFKLPSNWFYRFSYSNITIAYNYIVAS